MEKSISVETTSSSKKPVFKSICFTYKMKDHSVLVVGEDEKGDSIKNKYRYIEREYLDSILEKEKVLCFDGCYFNFPLIIQNKSLDEISLTSCILRKNVYIEENQIIKKIDLNNTYCFKKVIVISNIIEEARFDSMLFKEGVQINKCIFMKRATFRKVISFNIADFSNSRFENKADFTKATFGITIFNSTDFRQGVEFFDTVFYEDVFFRSAGLMGQVDFKNAQIKKSVVFEEVLMADAELSFKNAEANKGVFINTSFGTCIDVTFKKIEELNIEGCRIEQCIIFGNAMKSLSLYNTVNLGTVIIDWEKANVEQIVLVGQGVEQKIGISDKEKLVQVYKQFAMLKESFHSQGNYEQEDKAFITYMKYYKKTLSPFKRFLLRVLEIVGLYGTKPLRILGVMIISAMFFGIVDVAYLFICNDFHGELLYVAKGISFSFSTILDSGLITPLWNTKFDTWEILCGCIIALIECFIGMFLMSYLMVAVVRRTLR